MKVVSVPDPFPRWSKEGACNSDLTKVNCGNNYKSVANGISLTHTCGKNQVQDESARLSCPTNYTALVKSNNYYNLGKRNWQ